MRLILLLALAACATPSKVECACSCPGPAPGLPAWPEYGSYDRMPTPPSFDMQRLINSCDAGTTCVVITPTGAVL